MYASLTSYLLKADSLSQPVFKGLACNFEPLLCEISQFQDSLKHHQHQDDTTWLLYCKKFHEGVQVSDKVVPERLRCRLDPRRRSCRRCRRCRRSLTRRRLRTLALVLVAVAEVLRAHAGYDGVVAVLDRLRAAAVLGLDRILNGP